MVFTEWMLAVLYLIGGLNDLFMDLVFYCGPLRKWIAQGRNNPSVLPGELYDRPEQAIAILIPAWDESAVIGAMLESTCTRLDYVNYDIFVGTYPNDEPTQMEVARAAFDRPRIHRVVCPNDGPTSKADCLNWIVEAIKLKEQETGKRYAIFTLQDAEDVVHPLTLKVFNRFVPEYDLIQVPVVPYERPLHKLTGGTYLDEFAEVHLKNLDARLAVGGMVPSAGVGTAFGRAACDELAAQTNHVLFPPVSLTEDYDFSFRLFRNGRKSGLAKVWVMNTDNPANPYEELVAIREFFPAIFGDAVRQKQRWMLGITFQGWEKLGWGTTWRERYMLLRDRIGVLTSLLNAVTLLIVMDVSEAIVWATTHHRAWNSDLGRFHLPGALTGFIDVNIALLIYRIIQRAVCVKEVARRRQMLMVPFRLIWGNVIDFYCTLHAIRRYVHSRVTGKPLKWLKTAHEFPNVEQLLRTHRPLGDLLLERRLISPAQLSDALATQRWEGRGRRQLGEILMSMPAITAEQLNETLTVQARSKIRVQRAAEAELADQPIAARGESAEVKIAVVPVAAVPVAVEPMAAEVFELTPAVTAELAEAEVFEEAELPAPIPAPVVELDIPPRARPVFAAASAPNASQQPLPADLDLASLQAGVPAWLQVPAMQEETVAQPVPTFSVQAPTRPVLVPPRAVPATPVPAPVAKGPAPVIPISKPRPAANTPVRRFSMLHDVASKWKTPFPSKRILVAIGTRPEAIKLAPLVLELQARIGDQGGPEEVVVCATGQHTDMVEEALATFGVEVDLNLDVMSPGQTLADVGARILTRFSQIIAEFRPDWVIVQGDTATTAMAGLAAFYAGVRVAHVEAGLRTRDLAQPFPEEFNRRMVGIFANIHFAATEWAKNNLLREGVHEEDIIVTGNTGIDALHTNCGRLGLDLGRQRTAHRGPVRVLVTAHRRENLEDGIANICAAISNLVTNNPGRYVFLWPLHPNPRVGEIARAMLWDHRDVLLTGPAKYDELLGYLDQCDVVLTDSGGLQEEAPSFGKPVLILREKTERPEGVRAGMAWLVGTDRERIEGALEQLADQIAERRTLRTPFNPYGDGFASIRIADFFGGMQVKEFGAPVGRDEFGRKMPVPAGDFERLHSVS
jgi:adsorption protein B